MMGQETTVQIRASMDWWRREARTLRTSPRAVEIRAGSLVTRLLDAIERGDGLSPSINEALNSGDGTYRP